MLWVGLALMVVGAGLKVASAINANKKDQEEKREKAEYQKETAEYQRDTNLGIMERQLVSSMEQDYLQAQDLEAQRNAQSIASAQSSYIGQLAAEEQYTKGLVQQERGMGEVTAAMGASGAQQDTDLAAVINAEMSADNAAQRANIDKTRGLGTFQLNTANKASSVAQRRIEQRYEPGSAVSNLYNYQRERIVGGTELDTTYLQSVIDDNSDYLSWANWWGSDSMWGDILNAGAEIIDIGSWMIGKGFGTPKPAKAGTGAVKSNNGPLENR